MKKKEEHLHIKIDKESKEKLKIKAEEKGLNLSSYVRLLVKEASK